MRQVGIYAHLEGENEDRPELFAILQDETGYTIPAEAELADFSVTLYATIAIGTDANIQVKTDPAALVSFAALHDAIAEHNDDQAAHERRRKVIAQRERDPNKPDYGIDDGAEIALRTAPYTGKTEFGVVVNGEEYDAENVSTEIESAPSGTIILKKLEE